MILMMGIAGSGKGTQAARLVQDHDFKVLAMGDAVRAYVTGKRKEQMLAGWLLNDDEAIQIMDEMIRAQKDQDKVILDGFPRTPKQAQWLVEQAKTGRFTIDNIFHLIASEEAVKQRLINRARIDDTEEAIEKRFKQYHESTEPLLTWFEENGLHVDNINAERSVEEVNDDLVKLLPKD